MALSVSLVILSTPPLPIANGIAGSARCADQAATSRRFARADW
jgi:hypothetical protein